MSSTLPSRRQRDRSESSLAEVDRHAGTTRHRAVPALDDPRPASSTNRHADCSVRVVRGSTGDHPLVQRFLLSVIQGPSPTEFQAQLEEPGYEPLDRILIKRGEQIVGHVLIQSRGMYFGDRWLPVVSCHDLVTLPEYQEKGYEDVLCKVVEHQMAHQDAVLALTRTRSPLAFRRNGWVAFGRHSCSTAAVRDILSHLSATHSRHDSDSNPDYKTVLCSGRKRPNLNIRLWRHVEQVALSRLYLDNVQTGYGAPIRRDAYWRWLASRRGFERLYVAIEGPDKLELDDRLEPIVGYAVMKKGRLLEVMTDRRCPRARARLLARACGDAIEQDQSTIRVDAPPDDPLHQFVVAAGGSYHHHESDNGEVDMVKLADPFRFLSGLQGELRRRVDFPRAPKSFELGFCVDGEKLRLTVTRRRAEIAEGKLGRSYLDCSRAQFSQILLGHYDVSEAVAGGRLGASTSVAVDVARVLFPRLPLWRPPWDDSPA